MDREVHDANTRTLLAYEAAADAYVHAQEPPSPELLSFMSMFAAHFPSGGAVLEIGSATGHDAAVLEACGLSVQRTDAAVAFVTRLNGQGLSAKVLNVLTDDLAGPWDGIYANAVFLHLSVAQLQFVLERAATAVRPGGTLGFTVKEGDGDAWTTTKLGRPRYFNYWREPALRALVGDSPWELTALRRYAGRKDDWLQCICAL